MIDAGGHPLWWILTAACLLWYATVTVYVAWKGLADIRAMLRRLQATTDEKTTSGTDPGS